MGQIRRKLSVAGCAMGWRLTRGSANCANCHVSRDGDVNSNYSYYYSTHAAGRVVSGHGDTGQHPGRGRGHGRVFLLRGGEREQVPVRTVLLLQAVPRHPQARHLLPPLQGEGKEEKELRVT